MTNGPGASHRPSSAKAPKRRSTRLSIFLSFAFEPVGGAYDRAEILAVVERAAEIATYSLNRTHPHLRLSVDAEVLTYGEYLNDELHSKLRSADMLVVDISDLNPNVYYELGFASALGKPRILIGARAATLPSDIAGSFVLMYDSVGTIVGRLADRIRDCALEAMRITARGSVNCRAAWGDLDKTGRSIVVLGPRTSSKTAFMDIASANYIFLDNLGDKDSIVELSLLMTRLFPTVPLVRYISDDFPRDAYDNNLIVVGGPGVAGSQGNRIVSTLHRRLGIDVGYSNDGTKIVLPDSTEHSASFADDGRCTLDYGFYAKARNPFNPDCYVFMCHGIYTMGVLGAARVLSDHPAAEDNVSLVVNEVDASEGFWSVFPVQVLNGVPMITLLERKLLHPL